MATVKKIKKAQRGLRQALDQMKCFKGSCGPVREKGPGIGQRIRDAVDARRARKEIERDEAANKGKAGPLTKGSMWHPNDPEIYTKDPSASYWQERDYNEGKGVAKKVGEALKKPIMKKGGKVAKAKSGKVIKSAPKKAAVKKSSKKK